MILSPEQLKQGDKAKSAQPEQVRRRFRDSLQPTAEKFGTFRG